MHRILLVELLMKSVKVQIWGAVSSWGRDWQLEEMEQSACEIETISSGGGLARPEAVDWHHRS